MGEFVTPIILLPTGRAEIKLLGIGQWLVFFCDAKMLNS